MKKKWEESRRGSRKRRERSWKRKRKREGERGRGTGNGVGWSGKLEGFTRQLNPR